MPDNVVPNIPPNRAPIVVDPPVTVTTTPVPANSVTATLAANGVATAIVLLVNDTILSPHGVKLSPDDLAYLLLIVNSAAHVITPYAKALLAKRIVTPETK